MLVELKDITYTWDRGSPLEKTALGKVSVSFGSGEITAIIGPTGSGKSTLAQVLAGILKPDSGKILIDGRTIFPRKRGAREIAPNASISFQYPEEQMCRPLVFDEVAFGPRNLGLQKNEVEQRVIRALSLAGLDFDAYRERKTFSLSGGELRKVALAGVFAMETPLMILDEPTAGLDPETRHSILERLVSHEKETGSALVIITHDLEEVALKAERVIAMSEGKIVRDGKSAAVLSDAGLLASLGFDLPFPFALSGELKLRGLDAAFSSQDAAEIARDILLALDRKKSGVHP